MIFFRFFYFSLLLVALLAPKKADAGFPVLDISALLETGKGLMETVKNYEEIRTGRDGIEKGNLAIGFAKNSLSRVEKNEALGLSKEAKKIQEVMARSEKRYAEYQYEKKKLESDKRRYDSYRAQVMADPKGFAVDTAKGRNTVVSDFKNVKNDVETKRAESLAKKKQEKAEKDNDQKANGRDNKNSNGRRPFEEERDKNKEKEKDRGIFNDNKIVGDDFYLAEEDGGLVIKEDKGSELLADVPNSSANSPSETNKSPGRVPFVSVGEKYQQIYKSHILVSSALVGEEKKSEEKRYSNEIQGEVVLPFYFVDYCEMDAEMLLEEKALQACVVKLGESLHQKQIAAREQAIIEYNKMLTDFYRIYFANNLKELNDANQYPDKVSKELEEDMFPENGSNKEGIEGGALISKENLMLVNRQNRMMAMKSIYDSLLAIKNFTKEEVEYLKDNEEEDDL